MASDLGQDPSGKLARTPVEVLPPDATQALAHAMEHRSTPPGLPVQAGYGGHGQDWAGVAHRMLDGLGAGWHVAWKVIKLLICVFLDVADCIFGRVPGFGTVYDLVAALITVALWGNRGWYGMWELVDITDQIDGFVPTCTLIALASWKDN